MYISRDNIKFFFNKRNIIQFMQFLGIKSDEDSDLFQDAEEQKTFSEGFFLFYSPRYVIFIFLT